MIPVVVKAHDTAGYWAGLLISGKPLRVLQILPDRMYIVRPKAGSWTTKFPAPNSEVMYDLDMVGYDRAERLQLGTWVEPKKNWGRMVWWRSAAWRISGYRDKNTRVAYRQYARYNKYSDEWVWEDYSPEFWAAKEQEEGYDGTGLRLPKRILIGGKGLPLQPILPLLRNCMRYTKMAVRKRNLK